MNLEELKKVTQGAIDGDFVRYVDALHKLTPQEILNMLEVVQVAKKLTECESGSIEEMSARTDLIEVFKVFMFKTNKIKIDKENIVHVFVFANGSAREYHIAAHSVEEAKKKLKEWFSEPVDMPILKIYPYQPVHIDITK